MTTILHIISSPRQAQSYSTGLGNTIVRKLMRDDNTLIERDLTRDNPPFLSPEQTLALYKRPELHTEEERRSFGYSDRVIGELREADVIVIDTPTHNLGIAASLKAWLDQIVRIGASFTYTETGTRIGLLTGKKVYLAIASGGSPSKLDFIEPYLRAVLEIVGITDIQTLRIDKTIERELSKTDYEGICTDFPAGR